VRPRGGVSARERSFEVLSQARGECHPVECKDWSGSVGGAGGADPRPCDTSVGCVRPCAAPNAISRDGARQE
jgi:hypothetical protein